MTIEQARRMVRHVMSIDMETKDPLRVAAERLAEEAESYVAVGWDHTDESADLTKAIAEVHRVLTATRETVE